MRLTLALVAAITLAGCATIVEGTTQTITVDVSPPTGSCIVSREGAQLGISTPEHRGVTVSKSMHDLEFDCSAPGYQSRHDVMTSTLAAATVVSFFTLDLGIVDAVTGAWKKYPERIGVRLDPLPAPPPAPAAARKR